MASSLSENIQKLLALFPRGLNDRLLLWRLSRSGVRVDSHELVITLETLLESGQVRRIAGRWRLAEFEASRRPGPAPNSLRAVAGRVLPAAPQPAAALVEPEVPEAARQLPDWEPLLRYYAATQRFDPRGTVERFADEHGAKWQLFTCAGTWWLGSRVEVLADQMPGAIREALMADQAEGRAAVGWPIWALAAHAPPRCLPALLLPARWELSAAMLTITCDDVVPALNPAWAREARRRLGWSARDLEQRIFAAIEEPDDLADIASRLAHVLARIAPATLRPGDLAQEIELRHDRLWNAAAIFLPDENCFTRAAARDLEKIAEWGQPVRRGTALAALVAPEEYARDDDTVPLVALDSLSDSQFDAAVAALEGPLTAIQGPPGTGKSATILNLVVSILASRRSVLFASRNHRALDQVEERLREHFPDFEVMVRGRDAEGERDVDFLMVMRELVENTPLDPDADLTARAAADEVLGAAKRQTGQRREALDWARLHLRLSELVDRAVGLRNALPGAASLRSPSLLRRFFMWLAALFRRSVNVPDGPVPDGLTLAEVEERIAALRKKTSVGSTPPRGQ